MDNIAHTLSGLATRDVAPKSLFKSKPFFWVALVVANIPDMDIFAWFVSQEFYFRVHRGITHSVFLIPLWGLLGAAACYFISKKRVPFFKAWLWYSIIVIVHVTVDWITSYGTALFAPLSEKTYSAHLFPIVDIWFLLPLVILLLVGKFFSEQRRKVAVIVISFLLIYGGFRFTMKSSAENMVEKRYGVPGQILSFADIESWKTWLNPSMYRVVTFDDDSAISYEVAPLSNRLIIQGEYDLFDSTDMYWKDATSFSLSRDFILRSNLPIRKTSGDSFFVSDLRYTSDFGNWGSLTLYFPLEDGAISAAPKFLRPEIELW